MGLSPIVPACSSLGWRRHSTWRDRRDSLPVWCCDARRAHVHGIINLSHTWLLHQIASVRVAITGWSVLGVISTGPAIVRGVKGVERGSSRWMHLVGRPVSLCLLPAALSCYVIHRENRPLFLHFGWAIIWLILVSKGIPGSCIPSDASRPLYIRKMCISAYAPIIAKIDGRLYGRL